MHACMPACLPCCPVGAVEHKNKTSVEGHLLLSEHAARLQPLRRYATRHRHHTCLPPGRLSVLEPTIENTPSSWSSFGVSFEVLRARSDKSTDPGAADSVQCFLHAPEPHPGTHVRTHCPPLCCCCRRCRRRMHMGAREFARATRSQNTRNQRAWPREGGVQPGCVCRLRDRSVAEGLAFDL